MKTVRRPDLKSLAEHPTSDPLFKIPYSDVKDLEVGDETVITDTFSLSSFYCNADDIDKIQLNTPDSVRKYYNYYS